MVLRSTARGCHTGPFEPTIDQVGRLPDQVDVSTLLPLLEREPLRYLVTLKMINSYADSMSFFLVQNATGWAALSLLPTEASDWDRKAYPDTSHIAIIDGTGFMACQPLFGMLPRGPIVVKSGDTQIQTHLEDGMHASKVSSYISFTASAGDTGSPAQDIPPRSDRDSRAWSFFGNNGYETAELERYFRSGAKWFGAEADGHLASACFVFQNYGQVWEIAGVYTEPRYRRKGLARKAVASALTYLRSQRLITRYQVKWNNLASIHLAREAGLTEFLTVNHYRIDASTPGTI
jgi:GNAT superfamily N-acetyltransferase